MMPYWRENIEHWWDYEGRYDLPLIFGCSAVVGMLLILLFYIVHSGKEEAVERERLMQQCLADGKKEYECVALLRKPQSQVVPIPVFIPSGR